MINHNFNKAMGAVVRRQRQSHGMTMKALADQLGFSGSQISKYELGINAPPKLLPESLAFP